MFPSISNDNFGDGQNNSKYRACVPLSTWAVPGIVFVSVYHKHPWARAALGWSHVKSC